MEMNELSSIWTGLIADEYRDGQITTERGLQASLYRHIRQEMASVSIFVEPHHAVNCRCAKRYADM